MKNFIKKYWIAEISILSTFITLSYIQEDNFGVNFWPSGDSSLNDLIDNIICLILGIIVDIIIHLCIIVSKHLEKDRSFKFEKIIITVVLIILFETSYYLSFYTLYKPYQLQQNIIFILLIILSTKTIDTFLKYSVHRNVSGKSKDALCVFLIGSISFCIILTKLLLGSSNALCMSVELSVFSAVIFILLFIDYYSFNYYLRNKLSSSNKVP